MEVELEERIRILRATIAKLLRDRDRIAGKLEAGHDNQRKLIAAFAAVNRELGRTGAGEERG